MKRIYLFLSLLIITGLYSCEEELPPSIFSNGNANATRNGLDWNAGVFLGITPNFENRWGISIVRFNEFGIKRESLGFDKLKNVKTKQEIFTVSLTELTFNTSPDSADVFYTTVIDDGDVIGDFYEVVREGNENWLQIDEIVNGRVRGRFELHLKLSPNNPSLEIDAEPTIDFVNASFDVLANDFFFEE